MYRHYHLTIYVILHAPYMVSAYIIMIEMKGLKLLFGFHMLLFIITFICNVLSIIHSIVFTPLSSLMGY